MSLVELATVNDLPFLLASSSGLSPDRWRQKIAFGQVYVACDDGLQVGWLRYGMFRDEVPFLNGIHVVESHQERGVGEALLERWESDMRATGADFVLTAALQEDPSQFLYADRGYIDCGVILTPERGAESLFRKPLVAY